MNTQTVNAVNSIHIVTYAQSTQLFLCKAISAHNKTFHQAGRMAQQIRALAALEEDWSSSPRSLQLPVTLAQGDLEAFWFI